MYQKVLFMIDHLTGKVMFGFVRGLTRYLSDIEEEELMQFCSSTGFAKFHKEILVIIQSVDQKSINVTVTNGWWDSFRKRHPSLSLKYPSYAIEPCVPHLKHLMFISIFWKKH